jgi:anti-sigma factor RsiW
MTCSPFDLRDYFLQELPDPQQRQVEAHVKTCQPCREELDRLRVTGSALLSLRDEEIPQRIAFVSDKIFEPSPWRRWWTAFWGSAARLGFASAAMLSAAIVVFALRPVTPTMGVRLVGTAPPAQTIVQTISDTEIQTRVDAAVAKAVAQVEERQSEKTKTLVSEVESMRQRLQVAAIEWDMNQRRNITHAVQNAGYVGTHEQEIR